MKYIMALDQGTTSSRCILFDRNGMPVSTAQKEFTQYYPQPGWVEHDAMEIWATQIGVAKEAMLKIGAESSDIAAIGITNQRETTVIWDKATGKPVANAIVWQCRRTADMCAGLVKRGLTDFIRERTGLLIDPYFSATKVSYILHSDTEIMERAKRGELLFGTVETWLIWNLTGGKVHVTDYSNASRTMMFNIHTLKWDNDILELLDIPPQILPEVVNSSGVMGYTDPSLLGGEIPVGSAAGDQQAALFGQCCFEKGCVKNTYGTGAFLLMNTGSEPIRSESGLLTTVAWGIGGKVTYALEGSVFVAGAVIQWLRDELCLVRTASETEEIAESVEDTNGVYVVPAFVGLGAPYWKPDARGIITGLTRGANRAHIVRAALEAIAYQSADVMKAMEKDAGCEIRFVKTDGGASANNFLMRFQADIMNKSVHRPACLETTALGAAYMAGLAVNFWDGTDELAKLNKVAAEFEPSMSDEVRNRLLNGWAEAVKRAVV